MDVLTSLASNEGEEREMRDENKQHQLIPGWTGHHCACGRRETSVRSGPDLVNKSRNKGRTKWGKVP